jgi:hypothetical protein
MMCLKRMRTPARRILQSLFCWYGTDQYLSFQATAFLRSWWSSHGVSQIAFNARVTQTVPCLPSNQWMQAMANCYVQYYASKQILLKQQKSNTFSMFGWMDAHVCGKYIMPAPSIKENADLKRGIGTVVHIFLNLISKMVTF